MQGLHLSRSPLSSTQEEFREMPGTQLEDVTPRTGAASGTMVLTPRHSGLQTPKEALRRLQSAREDGGGSHARARDWSTAGADSQAPHLGALILGGSRTQG